MAPKVSSEFILQCYNLLFLFECPAASCRGLKWPLCASAVFLETKRAMYFAGYQGCAASGSGGRASESPLDGR